MLQRSQSVRRTFHPRNFARKAASRHLPEHARLLDVRHVDEDVVRGVAVQRRAEALLVEVVPDEPDAAPKYEQTVKRADLDVLVRLIRGERSTVTEQVDKADGDATIDVQDELMDA